MVFVQGVFRAQLSDGEASLVSLQWDLTLLFASVQSSARFLPGGKGYMQRILPGFPVPPELLHGHIIPKPGHEAEVGV
jgi:hypothetical protein